MRPRQIIKFLKRNKHFILLWISQIFSQVTINMMNFVMATKIFEKTGSTIAVSFLWVFYYMPSFFIGPFSGFFVDLLSRRKVLLISNLTQALIVLLYLPAGERIFIIYFVVFLYSLVNQFYYPAESASVPSLVNKEDLILANSLLLFTSQTSLVFGLGVSGIIMRLFGENKPIIISSFLLFLAAIAVYSLPEMKPLKKTIKSGLSEFWEEIKTGYLFIRNNTLVLFPILMVVFVQILIVILGVSIPSISSSLLGINIKDAGPTLIIPLGLGALCGAYFINKKKGKRKKAWIKTGLTLAFFVFVALSTIVPILMPSLRVISAIVLMFVLGLAGFMIFIPNQTLIQVNTPIFFRGRVFGTLGFLSTAVSMPLVLFSATIVDVVGIRLFLFIIALLLLSGLLFFEKAENYVLSRVVIN
ncbi:MFS transporter [Patescibacteria group bacterium]|nr:MFS transporter [Patescibacteria group bacterium]